MELQKGMEAFNAAGVAVYALSYDEPDALRDFRDAHGITYNLLSDPNSEVIRQFGILNTLIDSNDHPWFGIPYPGSYVVGSDGEIAAKFFDSNLAVRAGPEQLLRAALGESDESADAPNPAAEDPEAVQVDVSLDGTTLASTVQRDLVVRFGVPAGRHVYADPAPEGSVAVSIALDNNSRLVQRELRRPESHLHHLAGTGESFQVHDGVFELRLPLTVNGPAGQGQSTVSVAGEVRWQCCDDEVCDIPTSQRFELELPMASSPPPAIRGAGAELEPNAVAHFQKMVQRRQGSD